MIENLNVKLDSIPYMEKIVFFRSSFLICLCILSFLASFLLFSFLSLFWRWMFFVFDFAIVVLTFCGSLLKFCFFRNYIKYIEKKSRIKKSEISYCCILSIYSYTLITGIVFIVLRYICDFWVVFDGDEFYNSYDDLDFFYFEWII